MAINSANEEPSPGFDLRMELIIPVVTQEREISNVPTNDHLAFNSSDIFEIERKRRSRFARTATGHDDEKTRCYVIFS